MISFDVLNSFSCRSPDPRSAPGSRKSSAIPGIFPPKIISQKEKQGEGIFQEIFKARVDEIIFSRLADGF